MSKIVKLIIQFIGIVIVIFILWLVSEGYFDQAVNFLVKNPWMSIIIIIVIIFLLTIIQKRKE